MVMDNYIVLGSAAIAATAAIVVFSFATMRFSSLRARIYKAYWRISDFISLILYSDNKYLQLLRVVGFTLALFFGGYLVVVFFAWGCRYGC
jgi:hypothetical protein